MSAPRIYAGICPDEGCLARILFSCYESTIDCNHCGQQHVISNIRDVAEVKDQGLAMQTVFRNLFLTSSNPLMKKDEEMVKVLGLSNYHCKLLSPLLTDYGMDKRTNKAKPLSEMTDRPTFDCSLLGDRAFRIEPHHLNIPGFGRDLSGSQNYLADTLSIIKAANGNSRETLVPIHSDGDGHCLVHAVSRAIVGRELFWHPLRTNLKQHFGQNLDKYRALFQDFINVSEWAGIIAECDPEYEPTEEGELLGLRNIHVFGLANVLRRPIILLDSVAGMKSFGDYSAVFLPGLVPADQCRGKTGELNKPLCLAWSSLARNHYIPLVGVKGVPPPQFPRSLLPKVWGVSQSLLNDYIVFDTWDCVTIGGERCLQESYVRKLTQAMDSLFLEKYGVHPALVADVQHFCCRKIGVVNVKPPVAVQATQKVLHERRLYRCLTCDTCHVVNLASEWLRPGNKGLLYNIAVREFGQLREDKTYSFHSYGLTCTYDAHKDSLVLEKTEQLESCTWCKDTKMRLVLADGSLAYENGDMTRTRNTASCHCGFKHWWNGREYDFIPEIIPLVMSYEGRIIEETIPWFQYESDPAFNSSLYGEATYLVQKHFPADPASDLLVQKIVDQIREMLKHPDRIRNLDFEEHTAGNDPRALRERMSEASNSNSVGPSNVAGPSGLGAAGPSRRPEATLTSAELTDSDGDSEIYRKGQVEGAAGSSRGECSKAFEDDLLVAGGSGGDLYGDIEKTQREMMRQQRDYAQRKEGEYLLQMQRRLHRGKSSQTRHETDLEAVRVGPGYTTLKRKLAQDSRPSTSRQSNSSSLGVLNEHLLAGPSTSKRGKALDGPGKLALRINEVISSRPRGSRSPSSLDGGRSPTQHRPGRSPPTYDMRPRRSSPISPSSSSSNSP